MVPLLPSGTIHEGERDEGEGEGEDGRWYREVQRSDRVINKGERWNGIEEG